MVSGPELVAPPPSSVPWWDLKSRGFAGFSRLAAMVVAAADEIHGVVSNMSFVVGGAAVPPCHRPRL